MSTETQWDFHGTIARLESPWIEVKAERWTDAEGQRLEYWRVERADSLIVLPVHRGHLLLPRPQFRPGIQAATWDFPGGRFTPETPAGARAATLLEREIGVPGNAIVATRAINTAPWPVDSAFSSQRLWGLVAELQLPEETEAGASIGWRVPMTEAGYRELFAELTCLQCRALLREALALGRVASVSA